MSLFPLFLRLEGRRVLVVGGGAVAQRKISELLEAGARVQVVAPKVTAKLATLAKRKTLRWSRRAFRASDVRGAWFVVAATDDEQVNASVAKAAEKQRVFVNVVDDAEQASAYYGSVLRREPFIISLSSSGELPGLTRLLREVLEKTLPEERFIEQARALRAKWKRDSTPHASRFIELVRAAFKSA